MIENTEDEQIERLNSRIIELLREARMSRSKHQQSIRPGARIDAAIEVLRAEAMQAVADAAMQIKKTSQLSMREMLTDERARLNLSLQEVADRAGITKSHMWELEQGRAVNPTVRTVHGLAKALGIPFVSMAAGAMNDTEQA